MARTIAEIYDEIISIKEGTNELDELTPINETSQGFLNDNSSGSKVAIWRLWCWIFATVCWIQEVLLDKHKKEVDFAINHTPFGTLQWYHKMVLAFQLGFELVWDSERNQYIYSDVSSPAAVESRIVQRASVNVGNGQLQFKVANLDNEVPVPLEPQEKVSLMAYLTAIAYPGTNLVLISENADDLRLDLSIYFNPLVLNPDGSLVADSSTYPVVNAVNLFVQQLPFNGRLIIQKLIDAIQAVDGVMDLELHLVEARYGSLPYSSISREYVPFAGHMVLDIDESNISFVAYV